MMGSCEAIVQQLVDASCHHVFDRMEINAELLFGRRTVVQERLIGRRAHDSWHQLGIHFGRNFRHHVLGGGVRALFEGLTNVHGRLFEMRRTSKERVALAPANVLFNGSNVSFGHITHVHDASDTILNEFVRSVHIRHNGLGARVEVSLTRGLGSPDQRWIQDAQVVGMVLGEFPSSFFGKHLGQGVPVLLFLQDVGGRPVFGRVDMIASRRCGRLLTVINNDRCTTRSHRNLFHAKLVARVEDQLGASNGRGHKVIPSSTLVEEGTRTVNDGITTINRLVKRGGTVKVASIHNGQLVLGTRETGQELGLGAFPRRGTNGIVALFEEHFHNPRAQKATATGDTDSLRHG
mmetsp:Transcript_4736/g.9078  ORF Transcript_4736/g.9078 Transcript_4736/m.9078 type:complete len:349 (-) Transcript_4736:77-1123(-)